MQLADAHVHLFDAGFSGRYGRPCSGGDDLRVYESFRLEHRIGTALVLGYEGEPAYEGNNRHLGSLAGEHGWLVPLAYVPTESPRVPAAPFAGIAVYLSDNEHARRFAAWPRDVIEALSAAGAVVSVNASPETLSLVADTLRGLEGSHVLLSHLGQPGPFATAPTRREALATLASVLALSDAMNVGIKLSGFYSIANPPHAYPHDPAQPLVECLIEAFGSKRLYWGSDFSPALDYVSFEQTIQAASSLPWSEAERVDVMGRNLSRLLGTTV